MTVRVTTTTEIGRDVNTVADFAMNPDNAPRWYVNIKSVRWETPPPLGRGTRLTFVAHFLGRRLEYTYEVVQLEAHHRMVMRTAQGPFPMETTYVFERLGNDATRMTLRNHGSPSGFSRLVGPFP
jgi:hypothetical protein